MKRDSFKNIQDQFGFIGVLIVALVCQHLAAPQALAKKTENKNESYILVNHADASKYNDVDRLSQPGIERLIKYAKETETDVIGIVAERKKGLPQHYDLSQTKYTVDSENGSHGLKFPNAREVLLAGGNASRCLSPAIADVVAGIGQRARRPRLVLVTDAIYDTTHYWPKEWHKDHGRIIKSDRYLMSDLIGSIQKSGEGNSKLLGFLSKEILKSEYVEEYLKAYRGRDLKNKITFRLSVGDKVIGDVLGPSDYVVDIVLARTDELKSLPQSTNLENATGAKRSSGPSGTGKR